MCPKFPPNSKLVVGLAQLLVIMMSVENLENEEIGRYKTNLLSGFSSKNVQK